VSLGGYDRGTLLVFLCAFFFLSLRSNIATPLDSSAQLLGSMIEHNEFMNGKLVFTCMLVSNKMAPNPTDTSGTGY